MQARASSAEQQVQEQKSELQGLQASEPAPPVHYSMQSEAHGMQRQCAQISVEVTASPYTPYRAALQHDCHHGTILNVSSKAAASGQIVWSLVAPDCASACAQVDMLQAQYYEAETTDRLVRQAAADSSRAVQHQRDAQTAAQGAAAAVAHLQAQINNISLGRPC